MPRRTIELPSLPRLPETLPLEEEVNRGVDRLLSIIERDPVLNLINRAIEKVPIVPEKTFATPWGDYKTPEIYIPKLTPARLDGRQREAFKAAVVEDMVALLDAVPWLGALAEPVSDAISDTAAAKIQDTLSPDENTYFKSYNKIDPLSTIAMIRTMVRTQKER